MLFFSTLISYIPIVYLRYFLSDFELIPVAANTTGNTFFCMQVLCIYIVRDIQFQNSSTIS